MDDVWVLSEDNIHILCQLPDAWCLDSWAQNFAYDEFHILLPFRSW